MDRDSRTGPQPSKGAAIASVVVSGAALAVVLLWFWNTLTLPGPGEVCDELASAGCQTWDSLTMWAAIGVSVPVWLVASAAALIGTRRWSRPAARLVVLAPIVVVGVVTLWLVIKIPA